MVLKISRVPNAVVYVAALPDLSRDCEFLARAVRKSTFDKLHRSLNGSFNSRCQKYVQMIWHDHKFVQEEFPQGPVV